jgi:hypothetical protein
MYMMASIVYLVFGLALTSMCINVVQVRIPTVKLSCVRVYLGSNNVQLYSKHEPTRSAEAI